MTYGVRTKSAATRELAATADPALAPNSHLRARVAADFVLTP